MYYIGVTNLSRGFMIKWHLYTQEILELLRERVSLTSYKIYQMNQVLDNLKWQTTQTYEIFL